MMTTAVKYMILAAHKGHADAVKQLIAAGSDPDARNNCGDTALIILCAAHWHARIIKKMAGIGGRCP